MERRAARRRWPFARLEDADIVLPVQVLGELFSVLTRKGRHARADTRTIVLTWASSGATIGTTAGLMTDAVELAATHGLSIRGSVLLAAAAEAQCRLLLAEDMQHGFAGRGVTVHNPFLHEIQARRRRVLDSVGRGA